MAKRKKSRRTRRRGMGSVITVRRRRGMGNITTKQFQESILPPLVGGGLAALTALAIRYFVNPAQGQTQNMLVKHAPWVGMGVGTIASAALWMMSGAAPGASALTGATVVSLGNFAHDWVLKTKGAAVMASVMGAPAATPANGMTGYMGMGAIVPEYGGMNGVRGHMGAGTGAIVMEPVDPSTGRQPGTLGAPYGETVSLGSVNTAAFGTPAF